MTEESRVWHMPLGAVGEAVLAEALDIGCSPLLRCAVRFARGKGEGIGRDRGQVGATLALTAGRAAPDRAPPSQQLIGWWSTLFLLGFYVN